jgi:hypothetical protein
MKITLEPTELDQSPQNLHPKVTVETCYDDITIDEIMENLIIPALLGIGFQKETIDKYLGNK